MRAALAPLAVAALVCGIVLAPLASQQQAHAQDDPDILLFIAHQAEEQIRNQLEATYGDSVPADLQDLYLRGSDAVRSVEDSLPGDVELAGQNFLAAMGYFKQVTRQMTEAEQRPGTAGGGGEGEEGGAREGTAGTASPQPAPAASETGGSVPAAEMMMMMTTTTMEESASSNSTPPYMHPPTLPDRDLTSELHRLYKYFQKLRTVSENHDEIGIDPSGIERMFTDMLWQVAEGNATGARDSMGLLRSLIVEMEGALREHSSSSAPDRAAAFASRQLVIIRDMLEDAKLSDPQIPEIAAAESLIAEIESDIESGGISDAKKKFRQLILLAETIEESAGPATT